MPDIKQNITHVKAQIAATAAQCARETDSITLLAVSKTQPAERIRVAYAAGQRAFGENYVQEAVEKQASLADLAIQWHYIGPVQSNKTRIIAESFDWVHSVDRLKIAQRLSEQRPKTLAPLNICLQINLDNEPSKSGMSLTALPELAEQILSLPQLYLRGLMAIPAPRGNEHEQQQVFEQLATALANLHQALPSTNLINRAPLDTLSMGMSNDMTAAIRAGSTIVRVGTAIFGARQIMTEHP